MKHKNAKYLRLQSAKGKGEEGKAGLGGDEKPQSEKNAVSRWAIKIAARKAGRPEVGGSWRVRSETSGREEEREDEVEDSALLYETIHPSRS